MQGHRYGLFKKIADASNKCELELLIAHGGRLSNVEVAKLSKLAEVQAFVAQEDVLASSEIAIVHGGLNTVMDALARGVPLVLIPLAFEQSAIAARVARSGAGVVCPWAGRGVRPLASAIRNVLKNPCYRKAAISLGEEIERAGGVYRAADIVEAVLSTGQPVLRHGDSTSL